MKSYIFKAIGFLILALSTLHISAGDSVDDTQQNYRPDYVEALSVDPSQIFEMREFIHAIEVEKTKPLQALPTPTIDVTEIHFSPTDEIPLVKLIKGQPTVISFVDAAGNKWRVSSTHNFSKSFLTLDFAKKELREDAVIVEPKSVLGEAYFQVFLVGLDRPILIKAQADSQAFHAQKTIKIMQLSPDAELNQPTVAMISQTATAIDSDFRAALNGVKPDQYRKVNSDSASLIAWEKDGELLILTEYPTVIPVPSQSAVGINNWYAHRLISTSPLYVTDRLGRLIKVSLEL